SIHRVGEAYAIEIAHTDPASQAVVAPVRGAAAFDTVKLLALHAQHEGVSGTPTAPAPRSSSRARSGPTCETPPGPRSTPPGAALRRAARQASTISTTVLPGGRSVGTKIGSGIAPTSLGRLPRSDSSRPSATANCTASSHAR